MRDLNGLKVCFIAGTLGQGGAERQLFYMVRALAASGARPRVLTLMADEFWEGPLRSLGVPIDWVGGRRFRLARLQTIIGAARADRPHVVQSQHFYTNLYAVGAARALGVREVGAIRNNGQWEVTELGSFFGRFSLRAPRVVAANSQAAIRNAVALGMPPARLRFLPNVVDTHHFCPGPSAARSGPIRILAVGRRTRQKRFDRFLSVIAAVQKRSPRPTKAVLVTTGAAEQDTLEQQAARLGLSPESVEFRPAVGDMGPVYRDADIFLLTSDWEGTPNVVLEAMASGLPVVATRVGGVPEIVRHGETGLLMDPEDHDALVDSVLACIENDAARSLMGRRARDYVEERHSVRHLPATLGDFYGMVTA